MAKTTTKRRPAAARHTVAQGKSLTVKQHNLLRDHLVGLLARFENMRTTRIARYENIDVEYNGYLELDKEDKVVEQDNNLGKGIKPTPTKLMLADAQIDEIVTYLLSVLVPDSDMYTAVTEADKQQVAEAFTAVMNQHGDLFGHYTEFAAAFLNALKYNLAGLVVEWHKIAGNRIKPGSGGTFETVKGTINEGNKVTNADPYNLIYDASVPFKHLHSHGEYFGIVDTKTTFSVKRMFQTNELFEPPNYDPQKRGGQAAFFKERPTIHTEGQVSGATSSWHSIFSIARGSATGSTTSTTFAHELSTMFAWITPSEFGLSKETAMEIWRFTLLDNQYVVSAEQLVNVHGFLPIAPMRPVDDGFEDQSKSITERLLPMQRFASFLINVHQHAVRKSLYGLNIYDSKMIDIAKYSKEELMAGYIPAKVTDDKNLDNAMKQFRDTPETSNTLVDISNVVDLMQLMVPSNITKQVASLERATTYQAAATVQGSNRRNLKLAKTINAQAMVAARQMMATNIMQFQPDMEMTDQNTGERITVNPAEFRETDMVFTISEGLKGMDRLLVVEGLKDVINMLLQSNQAEKIDMVKLIDHWLSMFGDMTDFTQFEFESAIDALTPQQKDEAMQIYQAAIQQQQNPQGQPQTVPVQ